jgi:hypothetical protein
MSCDKDWIVVDRVILAQVFDTSVGLRYRSRLPIKLEVVFVFDSGRRAMMLMSSVVRTLRVTPWLTSQPLRGSVRMHGCLQFIANLESNTTGI